MCADVLSLRRLPHQIREGTGIFNPAADRIKGITLRVSKGVEFPLVALVGVGHLPAEGEDDRGVV